MKSIREAEVEGKKVLLRVDFNVPLKDNDMGGKEVSNDGRIKAALPTIKYLLEKKAKVIILSHLGRPDGNVVKEYSLDPAVLRLQELLGQIVTNCGECRGETAKMAVEAMKDGDILVMGNLRFQKEEEENDEDFAKELSSLGDIYVNDAFAVSHRAHASVEAITRFLPSYIGFLLEKEIEVLGNLMKDPEHEFILIMGGAKAKDKIPVIKKLLNKIDAVIFGGAVANTMLAAQGMELGASKMDKEGLEGAKRVLDEIKAAGKAVYLPLDLVVSSKTDGTGEIRTIKLDETFNPEWMALDVGLESIESYKKILSGAKTILWNGDMGMSEVAPFDEGTKAMAQVLAERTEGGAKTIICGGDTTGSISNMGLADKMTYLSTGGGAALEFLTGLELPGVKALG